MRLGIPSCIILLNIASEDYDGVERGGCASSVDSVRSVGVERNIDTCR